eukprot:520307-Rhodomonas_salina.2
MQRTHCGRWRTRLRFRFPSHAQRAIPGTDMACRGRESSIRQAQQTISGAGPRLWANGMQQRRFCLPQSASRCPLSLTRGVIERKECRTPRTCGHITSVWI